MNKVSKRIKEARVRAGLTQDQLGQILGWGQSRLSGYERGARQPTLEDISVLAEAIGCDEAEILLDYDGQNPMIQKIQNEISSFNEEELKSLKEQIDVIVRRRPSDF